MHMYSFLDVTFAGETVLVVLGLVAFGHLYSKRRPKHPPICQVKILIPILIRES